MLPPPRPADEADRLAALRATRIVDTAPEAAFDDFTRVAAALCGTPTALVTFIEEDRQWFKARVGFTAHETSRDVSFCAHAIHGDAPFIVQDARADKRFTDNPLVAHDPGIRFYAGVPLHVGEGSAVGTLCVIDYVPRVLSEAQLDGLRALGRHVGTELRRRRALTEGRRVRDRGHDLPVSEGDQVGDYRIGAEIGRGGIAVVTEATGPRGERVAIKFLQPEVLGSSEAVERFVREARFQLRLDSEHIARVLDVGDVDGRVPYIVMERLDGRDLVDVMAARGPLAPDEALDLALQASEALAVAHELGVVHRDLKPANLFLANTPRGPTLKVLDFGVARDTLWSRNDRLTMDGALVGTPQFMAPEQILGAHDSDHRVDVWSLGVVLYELLTSRVPFDGEAPMQVCARVLAQEPVPPRTYTPSLPRELEALVLRCLSKNPAGRPASMAHLGRELAAVRALLGRSPG